ncbi:hypothetical protein BMETH_2738_0 [methanotrophic bacterial endosymbiont of Bathymodiolus sp.]|nr:hypothetical protein BMETH_2738_0 [methanotrophic bacterial endosymbiont of Bathymodiolus sp.]
MVSVVISSINGNSNLKIKVIRPFQVRKDDRLKKARAPYVNIPVS